MPICAFKVPLVSLIFLKRSLVFPFLLFSSISLHWSLRKPFLSLLVILWNSAFKWVCLPSFPFPLANEIFIDDRGQFIFDWEISENPLREWIFASLCSESIVRQIFHWWQQNCNLELLSFNSKFCFLVQFRSYLNSNFSFSQLLCFLIYNG